MIEQTNKVWFITGTSSGLGKHLVHSALARGDRVIATVRNLKRAPVAPAGQRDRLHVVQLDVTASAAHIQKAVASALRVWGRIDVLVNNAGSGRKGVLEEVGEASAMEMFQTNVFSVMNVTNAVLPHMRERRSGTVVIIGSRSVWKTAPTIGLYAASKAAVHALGETYAAELRPYGVRVTVVAPGAFRTEIHDDGFAVDRRVPAYDAVRTASARMFEQVAVGAQGDPARAMKLLVDAVREEGPARGRGLPMYLMMGAVTFKDVRKLQEGVEKDMEDWEDVASDLDFQAAC